MDFLSIVTFLVVGLLSAIYIFFKKRFSYWKSRGVNYVEPTFPLGNVVFGENLKSMCDIVYQQKNDSQLMGAYIMMEPVLVPTSLSLIQNILVRDFSSFHDRGMYFNEQHDPLSANMFTLNGDKWRTIRSKLTPTFTSGKMKYMFSTLIEVAERFQNFMSDLVITESEIETRELLGRFNTDVIGSCAFGIECNSLKDPNAVFRFYGKKIFDEPNQGQFVQLVTLFYPNLCRKLHVKPIKKEVSDFFIKSVRDTIAYREENNIRRNDFMDLLIQLKSQREENGEGLKKFNDDEIAAQAFVFFAAGFETSSTTMMFALYELARNPEIQSKAQQEINDILEKHDGKLTYEAMQDMIYIDRIVTETLRKHPPALVLMRRAVQNYQIPNTKTIIENGTTILVPVYQIHRDPEIYPDPETFDPDRFSPEEVRSRHPMAFLGFGDGPRNCVGLRFGRMQTRIGLITLLQKFNFRPCEKTPDVIELEPGRIVATPKSGMFLNVRRI